MEGNKCNPLHKGGPSGEAKNYRPISILPVWSKVLEKHVLDCLSEFLHNFKFLNKTQSGFRVGHSCEIALIRTIYSWLHAIDNSQMIAVTMLY